MRALSQEPTWAQFSAWCTWRGFDPVEVRRDIERLEARLEAERWMAEVRRLAKEAGPHMTAEKWAENSRASDVAMRAHASALRRATEPKEGINT